MTTDERLAALEETCQALSARVLVLEDLVDGKADRSAVYGPIPKTMNTETVQYDRYGREQRQPIATRGFNEPL